MTSTERRKISTTRKVVSAVVALALAAAWIFYYDPIYSKAFAAKPAPIVACAGQATLEVWTGSRRCVEVTGDPPARALQQL